MSHSSELPAQRGVRRRACVAFLLGAPLLALVCPPCGQAASSPIEELLHRTGKVVESFWEQFSGVTCSEAITQTKFNAKGKVVYQQDSVFDYLVLLRMEGSDFSVEESRLTQRPPNTQKNVPLLVTNGFSTLVLIFHPYFQASFEFAQLEDEVLDGKRRLRVRFRHVRGSRSPSVLQLKGREYPLSLEGIAWIDSESSAIVKMVAHLESSMEDVGLRRLESEVRYAPVRFEGATQPYWLPVTVAIEAETPQQRWRNVHRFTGYRKFMVTTRITPSS